MDTPSRSGIAAYLFSTLSELAESSAHSPQDQQKSVAGTPSPLPADALSSLTRTVNDFAARLGHKERFSFDKPVYPAFTHALRDFFTDLNRSPNPMNSGTEHRNRVKDEAYHDALAALYEGVSGFMEAVDTPVERGLERFALDKDKPKEQQQPLLMKRVLRTDAQGITRPELEEVDHIDLDCKPVICLGGTANFRGNTKVTSGLMQLAEDTLGGKAACEQENVELYCVIYPVAHRTDFFRYTHAYNADPHHYHTPQAQMFCDKVLAPLLKSEDGSLLPLRDLKKACAKFNFFAYSYGTVFAQEIRNCLRDLFVAGGVGNEDIRDLLANAFCMSLGPLGRLDVDKPEGHFSGVHILSETDLSLMNKSANLELLTAGKRMIPLRDNEVIIRATPPAQGVIQPEGFDEDTAQMQPDAIAASPSETPPSSPDQEPPKISKNPSGHSASFYARPVVDGDIVHNPRYIGFSLPEALGMDSAYRNLDERFLPPRKPPESFSYTAEGRISIYAAAVMQEAARLR